MKKFKYVYYKLMPVLAFAKAESEEELLIRARHNVKEPPGGMFVDLATNKDCIDFKIPKNTIKQMNDFHSIMYVEEIK